MELVWINLTPYDALTNTMCLVSSFGGHNTLITQNGAHASK